MRLGKVQQVIGNKVKIIFDGENDGTTKAYKCLSSYVPSINDRILISEVGNSFVIIGKLEG